MNRLRISDCGLRIEMDLLLRFDLELVCTSVLGP